jgi:hypothetical protein
MSESKSAVDSVRPETGIIFEARRGFIAGVFATMIMSVALLLGMAMGGSLLPEAVPMAVMESLFGAEIGMGILLVATVVGHLIYGGSWGAVVAASMRPVTETKGVMLGVFLWLIEQLIVVPALGWGVFGTAMTPTIAASTFVFAGTSFLFHLVYGQTYGMLLVKEVV